MTSKTVLRAENLRKSYRGRAVVKDVSLHVEPGEIVGLLGTNGAGKTTSFYMMVGLVRPDAGRVLLSDRDITRLPMHKRALAGIGYLAQEESVFQKLTAAQNIMLILEMQPGIRRAERIARQDELLTSFTLDHVRDTQASLLSGGERRRVEIARVLAARPQFILLDEPFTGIDPIAIEQLQQIVHDLREQGIGILITDHHVQATLAITDRAYIISEGQVLTAGTEEELVNDPIAQKYYLGESQTDIIRSSLGRRGGKRAMDNGASDLPSAPTDPPRPHANARVDDGSTGTDDT